jgi:hypothetical protein
MKKRLCVAFLVLVSSVGVAGLVLVASATGARARGAKVRHVVGIEAVALDGSRVAYDVSLWERLRNGRLVRRPNMVLVWDLRSGKTTRVSGDETADADASAWSGVPQVAIAGSRVAWIATTRGGNISDLFVSSVLGAKVRHVAHAVRTNTGCGPGNVPGCAGDWLGGLVGAGNRIAVNRWTTDTSYAITAGGLDELRGTSLEQVASGTGTLTATAIDKGRVAVLRSDGTVGLYSSTGTLLLIVTPEAHATTVALSGRNLVVLESGGKLALYDARTGSLRKTFTLQGRQGSLPPPAVDVQGNIAVYTTGRSVNRTIRAINLSSGKDRPVGHHPYPISYASIDSFGLLYAVNGTPDIPGTLVFIPFKQVAATVS